MSSRAGVGEYFIRRFGAFRSAGLHHVSLAVGWMASHLTPDPLREIDRLIERIQFYFRQDHTLELPLVFVNFPGQFSGFGIVPYLLNDRASAMHHDLLGICLGDFVFKFNSASGRQLDLNSDG